MGNLQRAPPGGVAAAPPRGMRNLGAVWRFLTRNKIAKSLIVQ